MPAMSPKDQARVKAAMAKLSPEDRRLAEAQVFCAIDQDSPLGTMGPIFKVVIKGQPVFLCCKGCVAEAHAHPDQTLAHFQSLSGAVIDDEHARRQRCRVHVSAACASPASLRVPTHGISLHP